MNPKPRYVFDNNTLVSALLFAQSVPRRAFDAALEHGDILISNATFAELYNVLGREKFDRYVTREEREAFLAMLLRDATLVDNTEEFHLCRDPNDNQFLELAVSGQASTLITGDQDLLVLHPFRSVAIVTPAQFLESLTQARKNSM